MADLQGKAAKQTAIRAITKRLLDAHVPANLRSATRPSMDMVSRRLVSHGLTAEDPKLTDALLEEVWKLPIADIEPLLKERIPQTQAQDDTGPRPAHQRARKGSNNKWARKGSNHK